MKRLLLIDVGNTRVKWAEASPQSPIRPRGRLATAQVTVAWISALAKTSAGQRVVIASVVPDLTRRLRRAFPRALFVGGTLRGLPLDFAYPRPAEVGADRIAAVIGAGKGPVLVVSCGTATAFSVLDRRGRFGGGAIMPGVATQLTALTGATAQLPATTLTPHPRALGKSTQAAIRAGIVLGYRGSVKEIIFRLRKELGAPARVLVTGGEADHLRRLRGVGRVEFRPLLVFEGLRIIAAAIPGS